MTLPRKDVPCLWPGDEVTRSEKRQNKNTPLQTFHLHLQLTAALVPGITIRVPIHPPQWAEYLNIDPTEADDTAVRFTPGSYPEETPRGPYWPGEYPTGRTSSTPISHTGSPIARPPLIVPPQIPTTSSMTSTPRARI